MRNLKYKLIGDNDVFNPIETVLKNRGVNDIPKLLKPTKKDCISPLKLINIKRAANTLIKHIEKGSELFIQVDSDP